MARAMNSGPWHRREALVAADVPCTPRIANNSASVSIKSFAGDTPIDLQGQAFSRVLIHDGEPLQGAPGSCAIEHEVPTPDMVPVFGPDADDNRSRSSPVVGVFRFFCGTFKALPTPQSVNPCVARTPRFAA